MGSFSEVVFSFDFRYDTPPEVLAAFSALEQPRPDDARRGPAPPLPAPVIEPSAHWDPDWRSNGEEDEFEGEPWRHDWASGLNRSMSVEMVPSAALVWAEPAGRWNLACRSSYKTGPRAVFEFLEWLGPFIYVWNDDLSKLVGYIHHAPHRPYLLWAEHRRLILEDLSTTEG